MSDVKNRDTHPHTIEAIAKATDLTPNYVRRIINKVPELVDEYGDKVKEEKNRLYFNNTGFKAFQAAARLKSENKSLAQIELHLRAGLPPAPEKTPEKHPDKDQIKTLISTPEHVPYAIYNDLKESYKERLKEAKEEYNERAAEKDETIALLSQTMKLLKAPPEELEREAQKRQAELDEAERVRQELADTKADQQQKIDELEQERQAKGQVEQSLKNTLQERDAAKQRAEALAKALKEHRAEREGLLNRLQLLEGKWFAGKERKEILARLRELDAEIEKLLENQTGGDLELEAKPE